MSLRPDDAKLAILKAGQEAFLEDVVKRCAAARLFGFDTETTAVEDWDLDVVGWDRSVGIHTVGYCLSWAPGFGVYVPFAHHRGLEGPWPDQMDFEFVRDTCRPLLDGTLGAVPVLHNLPFDYRVTLKDGIRLNPEAHDTSIIAKLVSWATGRWDPRGADHGESMRSLKSLTEELIGIEVTRMDDLFPEDQPGTTKRKKKRVIDYAGLNPFDPKAGRYAAADGSNTLRIFAPLMEMVQRLQLSAAYDIERRLAPVVAEMRHHGIAIDTDMAFAKAQEGREVAAQLQADYRAVMTERMGKVVEIDLDSSAQLSKLLFEEPPDGLGLPVIKRSAKTGKPSADKHVLETLARQHPEVRSILSYRGITKNLGTYLEGFPARVHPVTKRVHANLDPLRTETGRFASSNPNVQNLTRDGLQFDLEGGDRYTVNVRDIVVAGEGFYWLDFDYSQVEYRAMAGEAGEASLIQGWIKDPLMDVHAMTAAIIYGKPVSEVSKQERNRGKTMNFAILYGRGAEAVSTDLQMTVHEAQEFLQEYFARLPSVRRWAENVKAQARRDLYVTTKFGWRRNLTDEYTHSDRGIRAKGDRLAVNTKIQGVCAQILKIALVRLHRRIQENYGSNRMRLILTVHDSIGIEVAEGIDPAEAYDFAREALLWPIDGWPPLEVDCKVGYRYGSLADYRGGAIELPDRDYRTEPPPPEDNPVLAADPSDPMETVEAGVTNILIETGGFTEAQATGLLSLLSSRPGPNSVTVRVSGADVPVSLTTSLVPEDNEWIQVLGPVRVRWDTNDVLEGVAI